MRIAIQSGHENIQYNCDTRLRGYTGTANEVELTTRIRNRLAELLSQCGVEVTKLDANYNCDTSAGDIDYDLFLSLHGDMNYTDDAGGGFVDYPDPSVDLANKESKRIKENIEKEYFSYTGIKNVPSRSNANTKFYYMWNYLSGKTPCVILEMGEVNDPHDHVILSDTERTARGIFKGLEKAFNLKPIVKPDECKVENERIKVLEGEIEALKQKLILEQQSIATLKKQYSDLQTEQNNKIAEYKSNCQKQLVEYTAKIIKELQDIDKILQ